VKMSRWLHITMHGTSLRKSNQGVLGPLMLMILTQSSCDRSLQCIPLLDII
jgi:hypothetical protein